MSRDDERGMRTLESTDSPFHEGERAVQRRLGVEAVETWARQVVRDHLPAQHREFYSQLPFLIAAARDEEGRAWATLLEGNAGFVTSPDERSLHIEARRRPGRRARRGLAGGRRHRPARHRVRDAPPQPREWAHARRRRNARPRRRPELRQLPAVHPAARLDARRARRARRSGSAARSSRSGSRPGSREPTPSSSRRDSAGTRSERTSGWMPPTAAVHPGSSRSKTQVRWPSRTTRGTVTSTRSAT